MMSATSTRTRQDWRWFVGWLGVGAGMALGVLAILSIGLFVLALAALGAVVLIGRPGASRGLPGLLSGLGVAPLLVAYLNRDGPGDVCTAIGGGVACAQQWSPWPWLAVGAILLCAGFAWFVAGQGRGRAGGGGV